MELNLSGAHAPYFTRNVVVLYADNGETGVGEVPGGQKITKALEECIPLVVGTKVAEYKSTLLKVKKYLDAKGEEDVRGNQTFDLRTGVHVLTAIRTANGTESAMRKPLRLIRLLHLQRQQRKSMDLRISS